MPQSSTRNSWPPRLVTASTMQQRALRVHQLRQSFERLVRAGAGFGMDDADELASSDAAPARRRSARERKTSPQGASIACTVAPQRSITSFMRVPKTPLTQTMTSSPGSIRLTATHSIPAMPVPLTGNVSGFFVRKTCAQHFAGLVHDGQILRIEMAESGRRERAQHARRNRTRAGTKQDALDGKLGVHVE